MCSLQLPAAVIVDSLITIWFGIDVISPSSEPSSSPATAAAVEVVPSHCRANRSSSSSLLLASTAAACPCGSRGLPQPPPPPRSSLATAGSPPEPRSSPAAGVAELHRCHLI
uniref:Uncharacterized protein n=1 Tax=Oryza meridionalis TaxID=40149 RepID=A0A0E0DP38_9ORYZ